MLPGDKVEVWMRLAKFLQYSGLDGHTTEEKARIFAENGIKDVNWAFSNILKFDGQVDRKNCQNRED